MSFDSRYQVVVPKPVSDVYDALSSPDTFKPFLHLSPTCYSVEILSTDQIILYNSAELAVRSLQLS